MPQDKRAPNSLAKAADAVDGELHRYETLVGDLQHERLDSEKNLRRAAHMLTVLQESEARLREHLAALVAAVTEARERQQAQAAAVNGRAELIAERTRALAALLQRWSVLGEQAAELSRVVERFSGDAETNGSSHLNQDAVFAEVDERLAQLAADAEGLSSAAKEESFADLAKQAEGLRAQVLAARNKFRLARRAEG